MMTILNVSTVTDNSGEPPVVTESNQVVTVVRTSAPVITRMYYWFPCDCCDCADDGCAFCGCNCGCGNCNCGASSF